MAEETAEERAARRKRLQFLCNSKDFEAVRCRLFVTGLDASRSSKQALITLFTPFGRVYDLAMHQGYVFVQYDNMESSMAAIQQLDKTMFKGCSIRVKLAEKGKKAEVAEREPCRFFAYGTCMRGKSCFYLHGDPKASTTNVTYPGVSGSSASMNQPHGDQGRDRGPRREPDRGVDPMKRGRFPGNPREEGLGSLPPPIRASDRGLDHGSDRDRRDMERGGGIFPPTGRGNKRPLPDDFTDHGRRGRNQEDGMNRLPGQGPAGFGSLDRAGGLPAAARRPILESPSNRPAPAAPERKPLAQPSNAVGPRREAPPVDLRPPYDCVIIAGNEAQRNYCNLIEKKLTEFGMLTNTQVVGGDHLLKRAVEEAARRTVPYTICLTGNNEEHRSLTLNILHGVAQEHRNMPLEDAMPFLSRNFDNFVEMMKQKISAVNEWIAPDAKVGYCLNLLADGRRLTLEELRGVDRYIQNTMARMRSTEAAAETGNRISGLRDETREPARMGRSMDPPMGRTPQRHSLDKAAEVGLSVARGGLLGNHGLGDRGLDRERGRGLLDREREFAVDRERALVDRDRGFAGRNHLEGRGGSRGQLLPEPTREPAFNRPSEKDYGSVRDGGSLGQFGRSGVGAGDNRFAPANGRMFGSGNSSNPPAGAPLLGNTTAKRAMSDLISSTSMGGNRGFMY